MENRKENLKYKLGEILSQSNGGFIIAVTGILFALVYHIGFLITFGVLKITPMFYFNIFSVSYFGIITFLLIKFKGVNAAYYSAMVEVVLHAICADYFLTGYAGFHFLIFIMAVFPYLVEKKGFVAALPASFVCTVVFVFCVWYFDKIEAIYPLAIEVLRKIRFVNIAASLTLVLFMIVIFKLIIEYIEKNIERLNEKNEALLENILPRRVMEELRDKGYAEPEAYKNVSILFTDIVGFTSISKTMEPSVLIDELNDIFTHFDQIIENYGCVRIKTIGDAYMAVCGLPDSNMNSSRVMVAAAIDCRDYLEERNKNSKYKWKIRLGINTGEVVAGIVGIKKYIYDIFGDAVNVASRMESNSEAMKISVSQDVYERTKNDFTFTDRGEKEIKGKGMMKLYFVEK
jgi:class 3 adenylate cyclase